MILLGLTGRRGSGKDTAFSAIEEWAAERGVLASRRGFADKMKASGMRALGFVGTDEDLVVLADELKNLGEITTCIPNQSVLYTIDGRKFWQLYGTEAHREMFGADFWVDVLLPTGYSNPIMPKWWENFVVVDAVPDIAVVTDVRFENEARRIKELGGQIWEIHRGSLGHADTHVSEAGLPPDMIDLVIYNGREGNIEAFKHEVRVAMTTQFHMNFVEHPEEDFS